MHFFSRAIIASIAFAAASDAMAQPAVPILGHNFGVINDTALDTACTAAGSFTACSTVASDDGFAMRQIKVNDITYIQTYITDTTGFSSENYVRLSVPSVATEKLGIASRITFQDGNVVNGKVQAAAGTTGFIATAEVYSGWANPGKANSKDVITVLTHELGEYLTDGERFYDYFKYEGEFLTSNQSNDVIYMDMDQKIELTTVGDEQLFRTVIKDADSLADANATADFSFTTDGSTSQNTVRFKNGNQLQFIWIGQQMAEAPDFGFSTLTNFDFFTVDVSRPHSGIRDLTEPGPFKWETGGILEDEFGVAPSIPFF